MVMKSFKVVKNWKKNKQDIECSIVSVAGSLSRVFQGPWAVQTPMVQSRNTRQPFAC